MAKQNKLDCYYVHIMSDIQCRFATTEIDSRIANRSDAAEETSFTVHLPNAAFITHFEMEIDGELVVGEIKEKEEAKKTYEVAKFRGETAGHIAQMPRESNKFEISVNIKVGGEAKFKLVYQELLQRVRGVYKHQIHIRPQQFLPDLQVNVHIVERLPFRVIHVPKFAPKLHEKSNQQLLEYNKAADDVIVDTSCEDEISKASIQWRPSIEAQKELDVIDGQLVVLYDVEREEDTGEIQMVDGYFLHHFAPSGLVAGPKSIIFVLDTSKSMSGTKIQQTKEAMNMILPQLREEDHFNIITFDSSCKIWEQQSVISTEENIKKAIQWVSSLSSDGISTNINLALQEGISKFKSSSPDFMSHILLLLTDGQHNVGEKTNIASRAQCSMRTYIRPVNIYGLGFGRDADFDFLKEVSTKTGGFARKIYADSDAALQLKEFYEEISSPLLKDVMIKYLDPAVDVDSVVRNCHGDTFYNGSEMVFAGKLKSGTDVRAIQTEIHGRAAGGPFERNHQLQIQAPFPDLIPGMDLIPAAQKKMRARCSIGSFVERSWAYLTIKKLLETAEMESSSGLVTSMRKNALELSLKYGFVTGVTSMVAVKPVNLQWPAVVTQVTSSLVTSMRKNALELSLKNGFVTGVTSMVGVKPVNLQLEERRGAVPSFGGYHTAAKNADDPQSTPPLYVLDPMNRSCHLVSAGWKPKSICHIVDPSSSDAAPQWYRHRAAKPKRICQIVDPSSSDGAHQWYRAASLGEDTSVRMKIPEEFRTLRSLPEWLKQSREKIAQEFERQMPDFDETTTLLHLLRNAEPERAHAAIKQLLLPSNISTGNSDLMEAMANMELEDENPCEGDWIICCLVVGKFPDGEIDDVLNTLLCNPATSVKTIPSDFMHDIQWHVVVQTCLQNVAGVAQTFHIEQNLDTKCEDTMLCHKSDIVLKLKLATDDSEKGLDVGSESLFDAIQVIFLLKKICSPVIQLPSGLEKLLHLLFEIFEQSPGTSGGDKMADHDLWSTAATVRQALQKL